MVSSSAATPEAYLAELPDERRALISHVRDLVNANLPDGYVETMNWGMIAWEIPLAVYPDTYNKQPLMYAALAAQKNHFTVHLMTAYGDKKELAFIEDGFKKAGKKLDMGKACIRFKRLEDIPLEVIGESIARVPVDSYVARYESIKRK